MIIKFDKEVTLEKDQPYAISGDGSVIFEIDGWTEINTPILGRKIYEQK